MRDLLPDAKLVLFVGDAHADSQFMDAVYGYARGNGIDAVIQLGDFGAYCPWDHEFTDVCSTLVADSGIPLFWIAGNHDNWDWIDEQPRDDDGLVQHDGLTLIPRGTFFRLGGLDWFASGGSWSLDWRRRVKHVTMWPQEMMTEAWLDTIPSQHVDIMISHDAPPHETLSYGEYEYPSSASQRYITQELMKRVTPKTVLCGHHHQRREWEGKNGEYVIVLAHNAAAPADACIALDLTKFER